ncbi:type IX secretion system membrane protein PorP/SprF [Flavobacterium faecale]|uniref:PorP/SprF family type IX secretion system membrane protein n=1 Tax=Flavobacterium faecale TaxID=1355330 RepID=UPI003AABCE6D
MKKTILIVSFLFFIITINAQQDPQYTHYMYNMNVVNPAYATGSQSLLNLGMLYRSQWNDIEGAPKTMTVFGHMPVNKKVELGFSLISDNIGSGAKKEDNFYADFAYVLDLNNNHKLSLGLKVGVTTLKTNFDGFMFDSGDTSTDPAFAQNNNIIKPNVGIGAYYFTDTYYVGLSVPNLLASKHLEKKEGLKAFGSENTHAFLTAGYVLTLSNLWKLKPAFMTKYVKGAPVTLDLSANVLYNNQFELGAAYRIGDAVSALMGIRVLPSVRVGYSYDYTLSNLSQYNSGTHEIFVLFDLDLLKKGFDKSPRFF